MEDKNKVVIDSKDKKEMLGSIENVIKKDRATELTELLTDVAKNQQTIEEYQREILKKLVSIYEVLKNGRVKVQD